MNETLLDIAKRDLRQAKQLFAVRTDDEGDLNLVGYILQQSVEKALKHRLETTGRTFPGTHDIMELLNLTEEDEFPELLDIAGTITNMESKTRYIKNYRLSLRIVKRVMEVAENLVHKIDKLESNKHESYSDNNCSYRAIFPEYDDEINIPNGWFDSSNINDIVPSISYKCSDGRMIKILIDWKSQAKRHPPRSVRCTVFFNDEYIRSGNDISEIIQWCESKYGNA